MKKISMFLMASAMVMMVACGGKKAETTEGDAANANETEQVATEAPATESGSAFDKYMSIVDEIIPLYEKMMSGDAEATQKVTELSQKIQDIAPELQKDLANLTPEQAEKYQDAAKRLAEAAQKAMSK